MLKLTISFKENEKEKRLYDHIKAQFNQSVYIKELILKDIEKEDKK